MRLGRPRTKPGVIGPGVIAVESARRLLADPERLAEYEAGLFEPTPAVAAALDARLRRLRGYGPAGGGDDESG